MLKIYPDLSTDKDVSCVHELLDLKKRMNTSIISYSKASHNYASANSIFNAYKKMADNALKDCSSIKYIYEKENDVDDSCTINIDKFTLAEYKKITTEIEEKASARETQALIEAFNSKREQCRDTQMKAALYRKIPDYSHWSEGLERKIDTIKMPFKLNEKLLSEMENLGKKLGFKLDIIISESNWLEDYGVRRHDGKVLILDKKTPQVENPTLRANKDRVWAQDFISTLSPNEIVRGNSYLEGGNVINTIKSDGKSGAIIGYESIKYTLAILRQSSPKATEQDAINAIAKDLDLPIQDITFIPSKNIGHIDMTYRFFNNGEIAIPDYEAGIDMLIELLQSDAKNLDKAEILEIIKLMQQYSEATKDDYKKAEDNLTESGYKTVRVPAFVGGILGGPNYMNGVCGRDKNNKTFYITNKSQYPELDEQMKELLKKTFDIDNVYFVSTETGLSYGGGIDCLTQESK
ncbi:hypothetical protein IJG72_04885 [bacterium]|nr:hypothetical protein [bacterium]